MASRATITAAWLFLSAHSCKQDSLCMHVTPDDHITPLHVVLPLFSSHQSILCVCQLTMATSSLLYSLAVSLCFCSPELHVGLPLAALLEKTLESKSKDLLPQIMDAVETLRAVKPQQSTQSDSRNPPLLSGSQSTSSTSSSNTTTEIAAASASNEKASSELGSLGLGLPIDIIPGLSVPKKDPATGGGGGGGESKSVKPKLKQSDGTVLKDGAKGPARSKTAVANGSKGTVAVKEGVKVLKEREKEDSRSAVEKEGVSEEVSKEKQKMVSKLRSLKEEAKEKSVTGQKESSEKPSQDRGTLKSLAGGGKEKDKSGDAKKGGGKKEVGRGEPHKGELKGELREQSKTGVPRDSGGKESDGQPATADGESQVQETAAASGASRRKQHTPTRRSARIASISELREESNEDKGHPRPGQESGGSESDDGVEKKRVKQQRRRRKRLRDVAKATTSSSRKKARVLLSSSSEDSEIEKESGADPEDEEQGYESETEQPKEEDEKPSKKSKRVERRKARESKLTPERQPRRYRKRGRPQSQDDTLSQHQPKKLKKTAKKHLKTSVLKKGFKLKLHRFSSVKTRYNRLVKPNRKYSPYGELSNTESENSEEQHEEEDREEEDGDSDNEEERENISEEEPPKPPRRTRK